VSLRINTNIPAMTALRNLSEVDAMSNDTTIRLSTGLRINTAGDDPAGLVISEGMRSQLRGIGQALRNSQDAINMVKTAEGALDEVQRLLRDMRALAVHSANTAVVDSNVLQANQSQIRSTLQSIDRIARDTSFGKKRLLDGTSGALANLTSNNLASSIYMGSTFNGETLSTGTVTIARVSQADSAIITMGKGFASANAVVTLTGSVVINGYAIASPGNETASSLVGKINEVAATTGVTAQLVGTSPVTLVLRQTTSGAQHSISYFDSAQIFHTAASASDAGTDGVFNVIAQTDAGLQTVAFTGGRGAGDSGLRLTDNYGNVIQLTENGNASIGTGAGAQLAQVSSGAVKFQIGANEEQSTSYSMPTVFANRLGTSSVAGKTLADIDVTTEQGARDAMKIIDDAITQLSRTRGELGSFQKNFLESASRSLQVANENLAASESQVRDTDMAEEITKMTRYQILKQSGMSVLAQANQAPQSVLSLLRGQ
jgi:flagellin